MGSLHWLSPSLAKGEAFCNHGGTSETDALMAFFIEQLGEIDDVVGQWCLNKVPPHLKRQVDYDYEVDGQSVIIFEVRPRFMGKPGEVTRNPIAKFRYTKASGLWSIFWKRHTGKWHRYDPGDDTSDIAEALTVVDSDRYGCFFG